MEIKPGPLECELGSLPTVRCLLHIVTQGKWKFNEMLQTYWLVLVWLLVLCFVSCFVNGPILKFPRTRELTQITLIFGSDAWKSFSWRWTFCMICALSLIVEEFDSVHVFSLWNYDLLTPRHNHISIRFQYIYRFHGSYNAVYGGQSGDAYICLTGGVSESIDLKELHSKPTELFRRVKNALKSGSLVSCSVPVREPVYVPLPVKTKILLHYISSASTSANILLF